MHGDSSPVSSLTGISFQVYLSLSGLLASIPVRILSQGVVEGVSFSTILFFGISSGGPHGTHLQVCEGKEGGGAVFFTTDSIQIPKKGPIWPLRGLASSKASLVASSSEVCTIL